MHSNLRIDTSKLIAESCVDMNEMEEKRELLK